MRALQAIVNVLTSLAVLVSLATYYLSANKAWQLKHERSVARSVSLSSFMLYGATVVVQLLNNLLLGGPWQTSVEYSLALANSFFMVAVGMGWWVLGERAKGARALLSASLRTERQHLGALARALTHPTGSRKIIDILQRTAMLDGELQESERALIQMFADSWHIAVNWDYLLRQKGLPAAVQYALLRDEVEDYLAMTPPREQALQLGELIQRLVKADEQVTEAEAMMSAEMQQRLERYAGTGAGAVYEVHLVPQSSEAVEALAGMFPEMERRSVHQGVILVAATCYTREYAEVTRRQYVALDHYAAVAEVRGP